MTHECTYLHIQVGMLVKCGKCGDNGEITSQTDAVNVDAGAMVDELLKVYVCPECGATDSA